jgi:hypothetical protein
MTENDKNEEQLDENEQEELEEIKRLTVRIMEMVVTSLRERNYSSDDPECRHTMAAFATAPAIAVAHLIAIQEATMKDGSAEMALTILKQTMVFMKGEFDRIYAELKVEASGVRQGATETLQ